MSAVTSGMTDRLSDRRYDVVLHGAYFCDLVFNGLPEMPQLGRDIFSASFELVPGGAFYTALALHRLGLRSGWICDFGNDIFSRFIVESAEDEGVNSALFRHRDEPLRRLASVFSFQHDRGFISFSDEAMPEALPMDELERLRPRCLLLAAISFWQDLYRLQDLRWRNELVVFMDCQDSDLSLDTPGLVEALGCLDVFAPNETEALHLTGESRVEDALARLADIVPTVVIKRGVHGALAQRGREIVHAAPIAVQAVDTTGAGDSFNAGFVYGLLQRASLTDCVRYANIVGGLTTTAPGGLHRKYMPLNLEDYYPQS